MGRIGKTYSRPDVSAKVPIVKGRVLFLSRAAAIRHRLRRAEPLAWFCLLVGLVGALAAVGI